ncbi:MAG: MFS transporter [Xanthomonadales bacterium]|nr:MFS transporter [Xanthomonadales bacterium]
MFGQLDSVELRTGITLTGVIAFRMLGLFMILPVFMLLAADMPGFSPAKAGLAVGIYGLTQALLQQPFGKLSDRFGRRPVMLAGLALFAAGGVVAALAESIEMVIAGRALQGCGAIAGVALAFAADHTRPQNRSVIMAIIGMGIGASFLLSMMIAVPLSTLLGLRGLFWLTVTLGVLGMLLVVSLPPEHITKEEDLQESGQSSTIWLFALSVFLLHAVMTLLFVVLPGMLVSQFAFELEYHWRIYVPSMLGSVILVFPLLRRITARKKEKSAMPLAFLVLGGALGLMSLGQSLVAMIVFALAFFLAFNLLEAAMPSVVSQMSGTRGRGRKMGLYTTFQFLGAFAGGLGGGWLLGYGGNVVTLSVAGSLCTLWAVAMLIWLKSADNSQQT